MGKAFREAYPNLVKDHFTRAGSDERVVESGQFFLQGLEGQEYSLKANKSAVDVVCVTYLLWGRRLTGRSSQKPMGRTTHCQSAPV